MLPECNALPANAQKPHARRVPWQRLLQARNEYIDWQKFYLWVRSVLESENRIPDWLLEVLDKRCPGFVENERELTPKAASIGLCLSA
jgi:hypothetical protein